MRIPKIAVTCVVLAAAVLLASGCGRSADTAPAPASALTQAQRDSVLAASRIPGAGAVGRALEVADSSAARARRLDADPR